ncbi:vacuolar sorting protein Vps32 [Schizosaccharomyces japonicus yFS275]|uniref:Vacuolar-sorting protein SNF7 n=1 Tax=Schizosaccharomyces japonicus (strain yFS275 / FY16936) TaxID=402676 RepID=B6K054_SCHJY|nr:vacuolar sorting protein Vps32 [Schizosaccharomyces japonicus yFS275]EEB06204.1 vacuolar sorting protein Vps32 [Schizosaccharomyces japonicus yFS275]
MSSFFRWFGGGNKEKDTAKDTIVKFQEMLSLFDKKEEKLEKQIEQQNEIARKNATANKRLALTALKRKKMYEAELAKIEGSRNNIEQQLYTIQNANLNFETLQAMRQGADAMKKIQKGMDADKVDQIMDRIRDQQAVSEEISTMISTPIGLNADMDEDELTAELEELQQVELDNKMLGAEKPPIHAPSLPSTGKVPTLPSVQKPQVLDEEEELRKLQAEFSM